MNSILERGANFIWENARLLDRAIFEYRFRNGSPDRILQILRAYQNDDGGFGHALEADLRAPESNPLFAEYALETLYACGLRDAEMTYRACDFLAKYADLKKGIPTLLPSARNYPRAGHWHNLDNELPAFDRLTSLVGLANWQGIQHPWLQEAVQVCLDHISSNKYSDAHTIKNAFCLLESVSRQKPVDELFKKLSDELFVADFFITEIPARSYGLNPLDFAPLPDSYCRPIFSDDQIDAQLAYLQTQQSEDGGWPITWEPPGAMARLEWRGNRTVKSLYTLRAYGRI